MAQGLSIFCCCIAIQPCNLTTITKKTISIHFATQQTLLSMFSSHDADIFLCLLFKISVIQYLCSYNERTRIFIFSCFVIVTVRILNNTRIINNNVKCMVTINTPKNLSQAIRLAYAADSTYIHSQRTVLSLSSLFTRSISIGSKRRIIKREHGKASTASRNCQIFEYENSWTRR